MCLKYLISTNQYFVDVDEGYQICQNQMQKETTYSNIKNYYFVFNFSFSHLHLT